MDAAGARRRPAPHRRHRGVRPVHRWPAGYLSAGPAEVGFLADDDSVAVAVPVGDAAARSPARALAAHATQVELLDGGFALSNRIAQPLLDAEYYRLLAGDAPPRGPAGAPADNVFAGLQ